MGKGKLIKHIKPLDPKLDLKKVSKERPDLIPKIPAWHFYQLENVEYELSNFKLHIYIPLDLYFAIPGKIKEILKQAVIDGTIPSFKLLNRPSKDVEEKSKSEKTVEEDADLRLLNSPFTIYLTPNFDLLKIRDLCNQIEEALNEAQVPKCKRKHLSKADLPFTDHITFRQERLNNKYVAINKASPEQLMELKEGGENSYEYKALLSSFAHQAAVKATQEAVKTSLKKDIEQTNFHPTHWKNTESNTIAALGKILPATQTIKSIYDQWGSLDLQGIDEAFRNSSKQFSFFRSREAKTFYENQNNSLNSYFAKAAIEAVITSFRSLPAVEWGGVFVKNDLLGDQGKKLPKTAAKIVKIYEEAKKSKQTWENALKEIQDILTNEYHTSDKLPWLRSEKTQQVYNQALGIIHEKYDSEIKKYLRLEFSSPQVLGAFLKDKIVPRISNIEIKHPNLVIKQQLLTIQNDVNKLIQNLINFLNTSNEANKQESYIQYTAYQLFVLAKQLSKLNGKEDKLYKEVLFFIGELINDKTITRESVEASKIREMLNDNDNKKYLSEIRKNRRADLSSVKKIVAWLETVYTTIPQVGNGPLEITDRALTLIKNLSKGLNQSHDESKNEKLIQHTAYELSLLADELKQSEATKEGNLYKEIMLCISELMDERLQRMQAIEKSHMKQIEKALKDNEDYLSAISQEFKASYKP